MNTKKFFMLLAAVLLGSVSAMAQSGNNEPLKGDVNGDGKVDVGDITAVIKIMKENATQPTTYYWYVGTTAVNPSNYTSVANKVQQIPASTTIKLNDEKFYIVAPSDKSIEALTSDGDIITLFSYDTSANAFNYRLTTLGDGYTLYESLSSITDNAAQINVR